MSHISSRYLLLLMAFFFCVSLSLFVEPSHVQAASDADTFVTRSGTKFTLNGKDFKFVGFNLFDAAATDRYKCAWWPRFTDSELDATLKYMRQSSGATVLRFWAFQTYTKSGQDWSGMDRVLRIAKQNGFKVLPVLENGTGGCTGNPSMEKWQYQGDSWYVSGYKVKFGTDALSYRESHDFWVGDDE
jgi:mannan endo-1,4-beta-mannosidase